MTEFRVNLPQSEMPGEQKKLPERRENDPSGQDNADKKSQGVSGAGMETEFQLPYYDFILLGHSISGKTTYLTMLCEEGGDKNQSWNFAPGGSILDVPEKIRSQEELKEYSEIVSRIEAETTRDINETRKEISRGNGSYSTLGFNERVFTFKPAGERMPPRTLFSLDYPGELLSQAEKGEGGEEHYRQRMDQFARQLCKSQALVIMIDPEVYLHGDSSERLFYGRGLKYAQDKMRELKRDPRLVPRERMPVVILLNKADLVAENETELGREDARDFLKEHCRHLYAQVGHFTTNWTACFTSCWGLGVQHEAIAGPKGGFKPPATPRPYNLEKPLQWLIEQGSKRWRNSILRNVGVGVVAVAMVTALLCTWDSQSYERLLAQEPTYGDDPALMFDKYETYKKYHMHSALTGYRGKVEARQKILIKSYLAQGLKGRESLEMEDLDSLRAQVKEWCLVMNDKIFAAKMEERLAMDVDPLLERLYIAKLNRAVDSEEFGQVFDSYRRIFPRSEKILSLLEKRDYSNIFSLANSASLSPEDCQRLILACINFEEAYGSEDTAYMDSVNDLMHFFATFLEFNGGNFAERELSGSFLGFGLASDMIGTHEEKTSLKKNKHVEECRKIERPLWFDTIKCYDTVVPVYEESIISVENKPAVTVTVKVDDVVVFHEGPVQEKAYTTSRNFNYTWSPGQTIAVKVVNQTGKTVERSASGLLAINALKGVLNLGDGSEVSFMGEDMALPKLVSP